MTVWLWALRNWKLLAVLAALVAVWTAGYRFRAHIADADIATLNATHASTLSALDLAHRTQLQALTDAARATEQRLVADMAALDQQYNQEMTDAQRETDAALAAVRAGELRLRNRFTCPVASPGVGVPGVAAGTGGGDAAESGGLQREDAIVLVRLAAEADAVVRQLAACQAIVTADRALE